MFQFQLLKLPILLLSLICLSQNTWAKDDNKNAYIHKIKGTNNISYGEGTAPVEWAYVYKSWPLMGEPVQNCVLKYSLFKDQSFDLKDRKTGKVHTVKPPLELLRKVRLSIKGVEFYVNGGARVECDPGALMAPGIKDFMGREIDKAKTSFNVSGSPDWDELYFYHGRGGYTSAGHAKQIFKSLMGRTWTDNANLGSYLQEPKLRIGAIQRWFQKQQDDKRAAEKQKQAKQQGKNKPDKKLQKQQSTAKPGDKQAAQKQQHQNVNQPQRQQHSKSSSSNNRAGASGNSSGSKARQIQLGSNQSANQRPRYKAKVSGVDVPLERKRNSINGSMLLLIDTSGSMGGSRIRDAKSAAKELVRKATSQQTEVAVLAFSGDCNNPIAKRHGFSLNSRSLNAFINNLSTGGGTPMSAAVEYANVYMANNRSPGGASEMVLLLADGDDGCNIMSPVVSKLKNQGILYRHQSVGLELSRNSSAARDLRYIARESGGEFDNASRSSDLTRMFENAAMAMGILNMMGKNGANKSQQKPATSAAQQQKAIFSGFGE